VCGCGVLIHYQRPLVLCTRVVAERQRLVPNRIVESSGGCRNGGSGGGDRSADDDKHRKAQRPSREPQLLITLSPRRVVPHPSPYARSLHSGTDACAFQHGWAAELEAWGAQTRS
jgi:hypothetical protein